jgi:hypothetical protein
VIYGVGIILQMKRFRPLYGEFPRKKSAQEEVPVAPPILPCPNAKHSDLGWGRVFG